MAKYFSSKELACKCGCQVNLCSSKLQEALDHIRTMYGKPITLTSAYRCKAHNKAIGGAPKSKHMEGNAADLLRSEEHLLQLIKDNLEQLDLWMEAPSATPSWIHIQVVPYASWVPGMPREFAHE